MNETNVKEYWLGFRRAQYFIRYFLKKDFGHVYLVAKDEFNWIQIDPRNASLELHILAFKVEENVPQILSKKFGHRFIRIQIIEKINKWPNLNLFKTIYCINIVKYILGIKLWALTPYKLYRKLLRLNPRQMRKKGILKIELIG